VTGVRQAILGVTLTLVMVPFVLLAIAWLYEQAVIAVDLGALQTLAQRAVEQDETHWPALARSERIWLRRIEPSGQLSFDSATAPQALTRSALDGLFESGLSLLGAGSPSELLSEIDPHPAREPGANWHASATGQTVVINWAQPLPSGAVLLATRANHRGVRQLLLARNQLVKLVLYQAAIAVVISLLLARWLVRPLERLAEGARRYPVAPLAEGELLQRKDELGQLARAFNALTQSLEARRSDTVRLAADIGHELKNPLATIAAASELIAFTRDPSAQKRERVHATIDEAVQRLRLTTEALLDEVRLETSLASASRETLDYSQWLTALLDEYRRDPQHHGWTFELEVQPSVGTVRLDPQAWARLMRNLLDNARVQPSTTQTLRICASRLPQGLCTEVTDFGPGVSEGNRDKIFRRFFTLRPEGRAPGTGLGLSIVESVAKAHGGSVTLLPQQPGKGATFQVLIPAP
jgi:two-component system sensor histidine kinase ChvG